MSQLLSELRRNDSWFILLIGTLPGPRLVGRSFPERHSDRRKKTTQDFFFRTIKMEEIVTVVLENRLTTNTDQIYEKMCNLKHMKKTRTEGKKKR